MSASLYWRPEAPPEGSGLPDPLKFKLRERYDLFHGAASLSVECDAGYLEGLRDGGVDGAGTLLKALRKHERVVIWLES